MDAATIQRRIYYGWSKEALHEGQQFDLYRPSGPANPLDAANKITTLPAKTALDTSGKNPPTTGKYQWIGTFDGSQTRVGDYLVGSTQRFYVSSQRLLLPIGLVECPRTVNLVRPAVPTGVGALGYGGDVESTEVPLLTGWPGALVLAGGGGANEVGLPGDVKTPSWTLYIPAVADVTLQTSDIVTDDLERRYIVTAAELSPLGWRLLLQQAVT